MKVLAMAIEIGFIDYRSRFHISRDCGLTILVDHSAHY